MPPGNVAVYNEASQQAKEERTGVRPCLTALRTGEDGGESVLAAAGPAISSSSSVSSAFRSTRPWLETLSRDERSGAAAPPAPMLDLQQMSGVSKKLCSRHGYRP